MRGEVLIHLYNREHGIIYEAAPQAVWLGVSGETSAGKLLSRFARIAAIIGIVSLSAWSLPWVSFWTDSTLARYSATTRRLASTVSVNPNGELATLVNKGDNYQPRFDPKISPVNKIKIVSIGVNADIQEGSAENVEGALEKGIWRVAETGNPTNRTTPTIFAAHRFGYLAWTNIFRRQNSFYNLPKLAVGDTVEIVWQQRKYVYEVFAESRGETVGNIPADLILYTCESLNGPLRIFKYAKLLEI